MRKKMARRLVPTKSALEEINNSRDRKATQLGQIYSSLGGSDSTLKPNYAQSNPAPTASIPVLERAVEDTYNRLQSQSSPLTNANDRTSANARANLQNAATNYNAYKNDKTARTLASIGQTTEDASIPRGHLSLFSDNTWGLTPEMKEAGLTTRDVENLINTNDQQNIRETSNQLAEDHPILSSLGAVVANPVMAGENTIKNVANYLSGQSIQNYVNPATEIRQNVSEQIDNSRINDFLRGKVLKDKVNNVGSFAYNTANSILDMLTAMAIPGVSAPAVMGLEKGSDVINGAVDRGLTPDQIMAEGIGSGVTTALTEAIPFGKIAEGGNILGAMISEGLQEGSEDLADTLLDQIVTRAGGNVDKSELSTQLRNYLSAGYSQDDAVKAVRNDYIKTLLLDTLAGGISGGALGAGSNVMQGRNAFTGRIPTLETQTQNVNQTIPEVTQQMVDRMNEERAAQNTRNEDNARLNEALAKIEELRRQNEAANNDPELMNYLRDILSSTADESRNWKAAEPTTDEMLDYMRDILTSTSNESQNWENRQATIPTVNQNVEQNVRPNEQSIQTLNSPEQNARSIVDAFIQRGNFTREGLTSLRNELGMLVESNPMLQDTVGNMWNEVIDAVRNQQTKTQAPQNTTENVGLSPREINSYRQQTRSILSNLENFKDINTKDLQTELKNAFKELRNSNGDAQAVQNYNNVVNSINERMNGETFTTSMRDYMNPIFQNMKNVTDNYVIRVSNDAIKNQLGLKDVNELNSNVYTGNNSIKFRVSKNKGTPIDSAYMELYELAHGELPSPQNMAEADLLSALYNYIMNAKTGHNDVAETVSWSDMPVDNTSVLDTTLNMLNDFQKQIDQGKITGADIYDMQANIENIVRRNPELLNDISNEWEKVKDSFYNNGLDPDVANIQTEEEAVEALGQAVEDLDRALSYNLEMFSEGSDADEDIDEEDYRSHTGTYKTSKVATKTVPNSGIVTDAEFDTNFNPEDKQYEAVTHESTLNAAEDRIRNKGFKGATNDVLNSDGKEWTAEDTDTAMLCFKKAVNDARNAESFGIDKKEAWRKAGEIFLKIRQHATVGGQAIEALKKWSMRTPEGKLAQAIAYANQVEGVKKGDENLLAELKEAGKDNHIKFSEEFIEQFLEKAHQYDNQDVSKAKQTMLDIQLAHMVLDQAPPKFRDKFRSLWMDNLLASIRTLWTRNVGGNAGKWALDKTITKAFSGPIDALASKLTGERTTTGFTWSGFKAGLKGMANATGQTARNYWLSSADPDTKYIDLDKFGENYKENHQKALKELGNGILDLAKEIKDNFKENLYADPNVTNRAGINEENFLDLIRNNRSAFQNKGFIEKQLKLYDKLIKFGLAASDDPFYAFTYEQTLHELRQIRNNPQKYGGSLSKMSDAKFETWAKAYATAQGMEAVYQDNSEMAKGAADIKNGIAQLSEGMIGIDLISNPSFPFVRTPMNVIRTNLEYSPLGWVKNIVNTVKEINKNVQEGRKAFDVKNFDQARAVRETSRNVTGTLMFIAGLLMAKGGLLTGGYSDNDKEKQAQKEAGMQEYAYRSPFTGNQYSVDWIPGAGSDLVSAAAFYDAYNKPDQSFGEALMSGAKEGASSLFEMSALQGLQRLVGQGYNSDKGVIDNAIQSIANTASSAIVPAFVRQAAQAMDPYKRDTYSGDDKEDLIANTINNIPILREHMLQPRIGSNGEPIQQNPGRTTAQKWFDNLVNPASVTVPSALQDPVRDEAMRLYEETRSYGGFQPKMKRDYLEVGDHVTNAEEFAEFSRNANSAMNSAASTLIDSDYYQSLTADQQQKMLSDIYEYVREAERAELLDLDMDDLDGAAKAYAEDGEEGLLDYLTASNMLSRMDSGNDEKRREAVLDAIDGLDSDEIEEIIEGYTDRRDNAVEEINDLMSDTYDGMSSSEIKDLKGKIYSGIRTAELYQALGMDTSDLDGISRAYLDGGAEGVRDYCVAKDALSQMGIANNPTNRDKIIEVLNTQGADAVEQMVSDAQALSQLDFSDNMTFRYEHASQYIPTLTPQSYYDLFKAIDTDDPEKESIKQTELISYFNQNPNNYSSEDAMNYWLAFGPSKPWDKIPVLNVETGQWEAKKA